MSSDKDDLLLVNGSVRGSIINKRRQHTQLQLSLLAQAQEAPQLQPPSILNEVEGVLIWWKSMFEVFWVA